MTAVSLFPVASGLWDGLGTPSSISILSKNQVCRWNLDDIYHTFGDISTSGLGGHISISGCRCWPKSPFLNSPCSFLPGLQLENNTYRFSIKTSVGFILQAQRNVRKNRSAIWQLNNFVSKAGCKYNQRQRTPCQDISKSNAIHLTFDIQMAYVHIIMCRPRQFFVI